MSNKRKYKKSHSSQSKADKQEQERLWCYRYTQVKSFSKVAKEFNTHPMTVKRAWERLSQEEQQTLYDTHEEVSENLNKQIIRAEAIAESDFTKNIILARERLGRELVRRLGNDEETKNISNKDLASYLRIVTAIDEPNDNDKSKTEEPTLARLRISIMGGIDNN